MLEILCEPDADTPASTLALCLSSETDNGGSASLFCECTGGGADGLEVLGAAALDAFALGGPQ